MLDYNHFSRNSKALWKWFGTVKFSRDFLWGVCILTLVPLVSVLGAILVPYATTAFDISISLEQVWGVLGAFLFLYLFALGQRVAYDHKVIRKINIPAPKQIQNLLKTTTDREGFLINIELISAFKNSYPLSQTNLVNHVKEKGIEITAKRVRDYIVGLEELEIIHSPRTESWKKQYTLTEKGRWCYECTRRCFPKRYFWFVYRNYLGRKNLTQYPSRNQKT